jgi:DNA polymerase-3 subunit gamma/tau
MTLTPPAARETPANLVIETPAKKPAAVAAPVTGATATSPKVNVTALGKIRQQFEETGNGNAKPNSSLEQDRLLKAWQRYTEMLKEKKHAAVNTFSVARLRIIDENSFEIITASSLEKQFVEKQRNPLFDCLCQELRNALLKFNVITEENPDDRPRIEVPLSAKEQFQKMCEQYPMVRELKERLKLELDY